MTVNGYTTKTTFWEDFRIANAFGEKAVKDTYNRAFKEWKTNYIYLTELVLVLNWMCWQLYYMGKNSLSKLYSDLYYKTNTYARTHLKGEEFNYFFDTTD